MVSGHLQEKNGTFYAVLNYTVIHYHALIHKALKYAVKIEICTPKMIQFSVCLAA